MLKITNKIFFTLCICAVFVSGSKCSDLKYTAIKNKLIFVSLHDQSNINNLNSFYCMYVDEKYLFEIGLVRDASSIDSCFQNRITMDLLPPTQLMLTKDLNEEEILSLNFVNIINSLSNRGPVESVLDSCEIKERKISKSLIFNEIDKQVLTIHYTLECLAQSQMTFYKLKIEFAN